MKTLHTEDFYRNHWDEFIEHTGINLEEDLTEMMECYEELEISKQALKTIKKMNAKVIAEKTEKILREKMDSIKRIQKGEASLGYTTESQENQAKHELITNFEFNCLQVAEFKKKYL